MSNSIIINSTTTTGKKSQRSITHVNPDATNEQLADFAHKLNSLTDNTYSFTAKVQATEYVKPDVPAVPAVTLLLDDELLFFGEGGRNALVVPKDDIITLAADQIAEEHEGFGLLDEYRLYAQEDGVELLGFIWIEVDEGYLYDDFDYTELTFTSPTEPTEVVINWNPVDFERIDANTYCAKLTDFGALGVFRLTDEE